jgi:hypothetical protein
MSFALTNNASKSEISAAINYLLANFGPNLSADPNTGQITGPSGIVLAYLYRYLAVKYADSFDGTLNFSNSPTNRGYYGVNNRNSNVESTNPADYIWFKVAGGFGTLKFLYYQTGGGRSINFVVDLFPPDSTYIQDTGAAIDLDTVTSSTPSANSATTAYKVQNQADPAPTGFPQITAGSTIPVGFTAVLGPVTVGQVVWYTFGKYNRSSIATLDGVPPNSTYWSVPIAASVFQDIRSDNWNGGIPPTTGPYAPLGTQGYYIQRSTGNMYLNSIYGRGVAQFDGATSVPGGIGFAAASFNTSNNQFYGVYAESSANQGSAMFARNNNTSSLYTYAIEGEISNPNSSAIYATNSSLTGSGNAIQADTSSPTSTSILGTGGGTGVSGLGTYGPGVYGLSLISGYSVQCYTGFKWGLYTYPQPPGATYLLSGDGSWTRTSYASDRLTGTAGANELRFVEGTITGTGTASFVSTNKPGSSTSNVWIKITIDATTLYIPAWT